MEMIVACPRCKKHEVCVGKPGDKIILTCRECGAKGVVKFPQLKKEKKKIDVFGVKFTRGQLITLSISLIFVISLLFLLIIPIFQGNIHVLTVLSGSMEPKMHTGDVVFSSKVDPYSIKVGDIITFKYSTDSEPNRYVTHRVVKILQEKNGISFVTKGDANEDPDPRRVFPDEVVGKVTFVVPYLGYFGNFARSKIGYFIFLVIPAVLIIINEVVKIIRITKKNSEKKSSAGK